MDFVMLERRRILKICEALLVGDPPVICGVSVFVL